MHLRRDPLLNSLITQRDAAQANDPHAAPEIHRSRNPAEVSSYSPAAGSSYSEVANNGQTPNATTQPCALRSASCTTAGRRRGGDRGGEGGRAVPPGRGGPAGAGRASGWVMAQRWHSGSCVGRCRVPTPYACDRADLRGFRQAGMADPSFRGSEGTANAVWVRAHPGFKSPSLRHPDQGLRASSAESLIHVSDHRRLQMAH